MNTGDLGAGAVGSRGKLFRLLRSEVQLIKIDPITEEPVRDEDGYCKQVMKNKSNETYLVMNV